MSPAFGSVMVKTHQKMFLISFYDHIFRDKDLKVDDKAKGKVSVITHHNDRMR